MKTSREIGFPALSEHFFLLTLFASPRKLTIAEETGDMNGVPIDSLRSRPLSTNVILITLPPVPKLWVSPSGWVRLFFTKYNYA